MPEIWLALLVAIVFFSGALVKGALGLGMPLVVLPALSLVLPTAEAIAIFVLPAVVTNVVQALSGPHFKELVRRLWPYLLAGIVGTVIGVEILEGSDTHIMGAVLGTILVFYSAYALLAPRLPEPGAHESWLGPVCSSSAGVIFGMTGIFLVPGILYLENLRFDRDRLVQALGITFVTINSALAVAMAGSGLVHGEQAVLSAIAIGPLFAGFWLGRRLRHNISEQLFRKAFFILLGVIGITMIWRAF